MNMFKWFIGALLVVSIGAVSVAQADTISNARERRKERKEKIEKIVKAGEANEGKDGFLAPKEGLDSTKTALVKAENDDRKTGYEAIAKANGKSVEEVGKKAAEIMRAGAK